MRTRTLAALSVLFVLLPLLLAGCAGGRPLVLPGELARPGGAGGGLPAPPSAAGVVLAVADFAPSDRSGVEVGRDFDAVRPVRFPGNPGKAYGDLLSKVLSDRGFSVRRLAAGETPPAGALLVTGTLSEFRADVKRLWAFKVETAARVVVEMRAAGGPLAAPWTGSVTADVWSPQPFFVNPEKAGDALGQAAAAAAGEGADRLAKLLAAPGGGAAPR